MKNHSDQIDMVGILQYAQATLLKNNRVRKSVILCFVFVQFALHVHAQLGTVKGKVLDARTQQPLAFASVYINNTTLGVNATDKGEFLLENIPEGEQELIISFVGYQRHQSKILVRDTTAQFLTIELIQTELKPVEITAQRDIHWRRQLERFKRAFLGKTNNAALCTIRNPWVLDFSQSTSAVFKAEASDVLEIENLALGYRIFYELKSFSVGITKYYMAGNIRFEPILTEDSSLLRLWNENRVNAYLGSTRHLFKAIIDRSAVKQGFRVYEEFGLIMLNRWSKFYSHFGDDIFYYRTENILQPGKRAGEFKLKLPSKTEVHYLNKSATAKVYRDIPHPVSWMEVREDVEVNREGVVLNPNSLIVSGAMGEARVAELLPYDYKFILKTQKVQRPN